MLKMLATCAVLAAGAAFALPEPAHAKNTGLDGFRNSDQVEVSDRRRKRRYHRHVYRRHWGPRYWGPPPFFFAPGPYAYAPYYYRPRPFIGFGVGPFGFGIW